MQLHAQGREGGSVGGAARHQSGIQAPNDESQSANAIRQIEIVQKPGFGLYIGVRVPGGGVLCFAPGTNQEFDAIDVRGIGLVVGGCADPVTDFVGEGAHFEAVIAAVGRAVLQNQGVEVTEKQFRVIEGIGLEPRCNVVVGSVEQTVDALDEQIAFQNAFDVLANGFVGGQGLT